MLLRRTWRVFARDAQLPPPGDWRTWLILAGRGFGKTRSGAEWVRARIKRGAGRVALIAPTLGDARDIMVRGESGLLSVCWQGDVTAQGRLLGRPVFQPTLRRVTWANGAYAVLFSAEEPERLRGPQHDLLWADELAAWRYARQTWDMAMLGLRLGRDPRACVTTTPKPVDLLRELAADRATAVTRGSTYDNAANLAPGFLETVRAKYEGTSLGRQELHAEILEETDGALWSRRQLDAVRGPTPGDFLRIVVAVDPPAGSKATSDACGIVAAGLWSDGRAHVIADASLRAAKPTRWAAEAVALYEKLGADVIIAEVNQGGDMVEAVIRQVDPRVALRKVHARRAKWLRAEPVAALYEQGRVTHAAGLGALEDEMCAFSPEGLASGRSPDRLDALVWALSELLLARRGEPRVRGL
ncbi:terminase family protein [Oricola sp.]|uniref:DNA-packaging protein n=1 Tax=Oricola sp. TaxID=1979950 RepID=UPI0025EC9D64|nr:terminase family protein [Oricola sp.]MCI5073514.1 terminase family protein [Oricola sp.]